LCLRGKSLSRDAWRQGYLRGQEGGGECEQAGIRIKTWYKQGRGSGFKKASSISSGRIKGQVLTSSDARESSVGHTRGDKAAVDDAAVSSPDEKGWEGRVHRPSNVTGPLFDKRVKRTDHARKTGRRALPEVPSFS